MNVKAKKIIFENGQSLEDTLKNIKGVLKKSEQLNERVFEVKVTDPTELKGKISRQMLVYLTDKTCTIQGGIQFSDNVPAGTYTFTTDKNIAPYYFPIRTKEKHPTSDRIVEFVVRANGTVELLITGTGLISGFIVPVNLHYYVAR